MPQSFDPIYAGNWEALNEFLSGIVSEEDLAGILASVAAVDWHMIGAPGEPPFQSEFSNLGPPWAAAGFRHTLNNTVYLQGSVTHPADFDPQSTWLPIFQLPLELKPLGSIQFGCISNDNSMSKIVVWEDGTVIWGGYITGTFVSNIPYVSLGGVSFSVGASAT